MAQKSVINAPLKSDVEKRKEYVSTAVMMTIINSVLPFAAMCSKLKIKAARQIDRKCKATADNATGRVCFGALQIHAEVNVTSVAIMRKLVIISANVESGTCFNAGGK